MKPGDLVSVAPSLDEVGPAAQQAIEPIYCDAVTLVSLAGGEALVESSRTSKRHRVPVSYIRALRTQLFPDKASRSRAVVYLDQCVVSQLVKHARGELNGRHASAAEALSSALDEAVFEKETAICLESLDHRVESSALASGGRPGGEERFRGVNEFLALRSRQLSVKDRYEALEFQADQLAGLQSGGPVFLPERLWKLGLTRDPEESNAQTGVLGGSAVVTIPWTPLEGGPRVASQLEKGRRDGDFADFDTERLATIEALREAGRRALSHLFVSAASADLTSLREVLEGPGFEHLPCVDVRSTLVASLLSEPDRKFQDSDASDIEFVSCSLPFADLMMVDRNLQHRIKRHRLDEKYEVSVLGARLDDYEGAADWLRGRVR